MMKHQTYAVSLLAVLGLAGCGGGSSGSADEERGDACYTRYENPILTLSGVADSVSGAQIRNVTIANISVNGVRVMPANVLSTSTNVSMSGDALACQLPCAFSTMGGQYTFTVKAVGYQDQAAVVTAAYPRFTGGCPSTYAGTTSITLQMRSQ